MNHIPDAYTLYGRFFTPYVYMYPWYIYMLIGFYLLLPLLRLWVKDENRKQIKYFLVLSTVFAFVLPEIFTVVQKWTDVLEPVQYVYDTMNMQYVCGYTTYFILGWYINNYGVKRRKLLYVSGALSIFIIIIVTAILTFSTSERTDLYDYMTVTMLLSSVSLFVYIKNKFSESEYAHKKENRLFLAISRCSLAIYLIHLPFVYNGIGILKTYGITSAATVIPLITLVAFFLSLLIAFIFGKIPVLKKFV